MCVQVFPGDIGKALYVPSRKAAISNQESKSLYRITLDDALVQDDSIGNGGFSRVLSTKYPYYCLKVTPEGDADALAAARDEIEVLSQMSEHPNIVRYFLSEERNGVGICVLLERGNCTLAQYFAQGFIHALTWDSRLQLLGGIRHGLMHLHQHGYFHGDVTPYNVLFRHANSVEVFLIDFGFARKSDPTQRTNDRLGERSDGRSRSAIFSRKAGGGTMGYIAVEVTNAPTMYVSSSSLIFLLPSLHLSSLFVCMFFVSQTSSHMYSLL